MITHSDLLHQYGNTKIPYSALLETKEWSNKRNEVIRRESNTCQDCSTHCVDDYSNANPFRRQPIVYEFFEVKDPVYDPNTGKLLGTLSREASTYSVQTDPYFAHIHHTYYILSRLPWEYPNEDLMLLCHKCHNQLHQSHIISVFLTEEKIETVKLSPCTRCGGVGHIPMFNYVQNGICFACGGSGFKKLV